MLRTPPLILVLFIALLAGAGTAAAQEAEPLGPQLRLTERGDDGSTDITPRGVDVAYNAVRDELLLVWENDAGVDSEIFGQRLAGDGTQRGPAFQISGAGSDPANVESTAPAVAYDPERDRYGVAFVRELSAAGEREIFVQIVSGEGRLLSFGGSASTVPAPASDVGFNDEGTAQPAANPDIVYRPDGDGDPATPDAFVVGYDGEEVDGDRQIQVTGLRATDGAPLTEPFLGQEGLRFDALVSIRPTTGDQARAPSLAVVPGSDDIAVVWETSVGSDRELFAARKPADLPFFRPATQVPVTATGPGAAEQAAAVALAADPGRGRLLAAYVADEINGDNEIRTQLLSPDLEPLGGDRQVSTAGPPGSGSAFRVATPSVAFLPGDRFLVAWVGRDTGRPGTGDNEEEVMAVVVGPDGAPVRSEFQVSSMGPPNDGRFEARETAVAALSRSGRWLPVWTGDDLTSPLVDNEFEAYGRLVGAPPAAPPAVAAPAPAVAVGGAAPLARRLRRVDVTVERGFAVFRGFTRVTRLRVARVRRGMRIELRCSGRGCPPALSGSGKVRRTRVRKPGRSDFTRLFRGARLAPGAVLEVRVLQRGAIGRVDRFRIRDAKLPARQLRCLPPGARTPRNC